MITQIDIENFRSIKKQSLPITKLNIVYGQNGSGKSSAMYAPYVFRNFYVNPNQRLNSLFNLGFMNLGGFENVINKVNSNEEYRIEIGVNFSLEKIQEEIVNMFSPYFVGKTVKLLFSLQKISGSYIELKSEDFRLVIPLDFPYNAIDNKVFVVGDEKMKWNGLSYQYIDGQILYTDIFNKVYEYLKNLEIISVKRGFFNALFNSKQDDDETKLALKIREEGLDFESKVDHYFKQIFDKTFRYVAIPSSDSFYLRTQNKAGLTTDLVNEGFGVNQTIYMLIKLLKKDTSLAFIEEPEIHLHPSAQSKLVDIFYDIVQKENKQIFITTHSENIVSTVLARIAEGKIQKEDVNFFLCKNEGGETIYELQEVNDNGQIKGGLMPFMESELSNLKSMLGI